MFGKTEFKHFLIHLGLAFALFLLLCYLFFYVWLPSSTNHGEAIEVPDLKGLTLDDAVVLAESKQMKIKVFDSSYAPEYAAHSVISHFPKLGEKVKSGRSIYVSISTKFPPKIKMPKLLGNSQKSAELTLKGYGLLLGDVSYTYGPHEGEVLKQTYNGQSIEPGTYLEKGSTINILVSLGPSNEQIIIPNLVGMSLSEAKSLLRTQGLDIGSVVYDENSSFKEGTVIKQKPENPRADTTYKIYIGEIIDLWVSGSSQK